MELKLCPHNQVNDALVDAIGPVVAQNPHVICVLERRSSGPNGFLPAQALPEDESGDVAVLLGHLEGECLVTSQVRGDSLELFEPVCLDDVCDVLPGEDLEGRVGGADDALVLGTEPDEKGRAFRWQLVLRTIDLPKGDDIDGSHCWTGWLGILRRSPRRKWLVVWWFTLG